MTYVFGFTGRSRLDDAFAAKSLEPNVVFTATDTDVIKTYVRLGFGVGIIASMAYDEESDSDLVRIDAGASVHIQHHAYWVSPGHIFAALHVTDLIQSFAPHLEPDTITKAQECFTAAEKETLFSDIELPIR